MKYMHFKASCSYAALANLLERMGIETEDTKIALEMDLPWLFAKDGNTFVSGPMLQSAEWFNLWLKPRGLIMTETEVQKDALCRILQSSGPLMLGIQTLYGKHAVVFTKYDGAYQFVNPTHENSGEKTELVLTEKELLDRTDETMMLASIGRTKPEPVDLCPYFRRSVQIIRENVAEIERFASVTHGPDLFPSALNRLFRPLLLDGISMLTLIGETTLAERFAVLQTELMSFLRGPRTERLKDGLSIDEFRNAAEEYVRLIEVKIGKTIMQETSTSTL
jgi:hypothetical protein